MHRLNMPLRLLHRTVTQALCRYGLSDSDDEDEGGSQVAMQEKSPPQPQKKAVVSTDKAAPAKQGYGLFDEDENMDDDSGSDQTGRHGNLLPSLPALYCAVLTRCLKLQP